MALQRGELSLCVYPHSLCVSFLVPHHFIPRSSFLQVACPEITILSGDDSLSLPLCSIGGKGVISVLSNIAPAAVKAAIDAALAGEYARAQELHLAMFPIMKVGSRVGG